MTLQHAVRHYPREQKVSWDWDVRNIHLALPCHGSFQIVPNQALFCLIKMVDQSLIAQKSNTKINVVNIRSPFLEDFWETFIEWIFIRLDQKPNILRTHHRKCKKCPFYEVKGLQKVNKKRWPDVDHVNFSVRFLGYKCQSTCKKTGILVNLPYKMGISN